MHTSGIPPLPVPAPTSGHSSTDSGKALHARNDRDTCHVELAPGCICIVPPSGLTIDRAFLLQRLPAWCLDVELARVCIKRGSRLEPVSDDEMGHCRIHWQNGWVLDAHHTVSVGGTTYASAMSLPLRHTNALQLGENGWQVTVRLNATALPL